MAYATQEDIESELQGIEFHNNSHLTPSALDDILAQESQVIDQYLSTQYETPVTNANALLVLKKICIDFTCFRVRKIFRNNEPLPENNEPRDVSESASYRESMRLLKKFSDGELSLSGATRLSTKTTIMGSRPSIATEPIFKRDEVQW